MSEREREDRCPYPKPFADGFEDCPAYQPVRFVPLDTRFQPLRPVWSCAHLDISSAGGRPYASCRLGGPAERVAWAARMSSDRLERWRSVAREFGDVLKDILASVYAAKAAQLKASAPRERQAAERNLRAQVDRFLSEDFRMMDERAAELEEIGFPVDAMKLVTRASMEALIQRPTVFGGYTPPAELLASFSSEIREFVRALFETPPSG